MEKNDSLAKRSREEPFEEKRLYDSNSDQVSIRRFAKAESGEQLVRVMPMANGMVSCADAFEARWSAATEAISKRLVLLQTDDRRISIKASSQYMYTSNGSCPPWYRDYWDIKEEKRSHDSMGDGYWKKDAKSEVVQDYESLESHTVLLFVEWVLVCQ